jgi:hypothetical protein
MMQSLTISNEPSEARWKKSRQKNETQPAPRTGGQRESGTRLCVGLFPNTVTAFLLTKGNMIKTIAMIMLAATLAGCGAMANSRAHHMTDSELQLARYQTMSRLHGPHFASDRIGDDGGLSGEYRQKEAYERELARRGLLDYRTAPHVTYW